ncbi:MAG TPA: hypothetical protein VJN94_11510 [Candidatus Binataceae bacterium]|nr:hypothetical protein [Candidatus Binataceae bacterium]
MLSRLIYIAVAVSGVLLGVLLALRLTGPGKPVDSSRSASSAIMTPLAVEVSQNATRSPASSTTYGTLSNLLELPQASHDFVGDWGGYTHSTIVRIAPELEGTSPDRVSIVFGQAGDSIFAQSVLYTPANQRVVLKATATLFGARRFLIRYEAEDRELYYVYAHRFDLIHTGEISYRGTIKVYSLHGHGLLGIVTQRATLKRLLTVREQLRFARPSLQEIPRAEISAVEMLGKH